ncbi:MAG: Gldg family protein [Synergistaceae bacterium]|jgi:ABC-2 type transport system permease protein|nr:Gldg family protein [Synergistaceae bacterium]
MTGTFQKELRLYFSTASGYAFFAVFIVIAGALFIVANLMPADGDIKSFFSSFFPSVNFMIPILTMRLYAEERKTRTDELLLTSPAGVAVVVVGKFLASLFVFVACLAVSAVFPLILAGCGAPPSVESVGGYVGLVLLASALIAVGLFISTCSENQIVSAILTYAVFFALHLASGARSLAGGGTLGETFSFSFSFSFFSLIFSLISSLSLTGRFIRFANGLFDPSGVIFYFSVTVFFLYLSIRHIERARIAPERKHASRTIFALSALLFILVNLCSSIAAQKFDLSIDMTENRLYALSPAAVQAVNSLASPITVTVVSDEESFPDVLSEMLRRLSRASRHVGVRYADPYENPLLIDHYRQLGYAPDVSDILVEGERGIRLIKYGDLFLRRNGDIYGIQLEQQLVNAALAVSSGTSGTRRKAVFTFGHGERSSSALRNLFSSNGFKLKDIYAGSGIDGDVNVAVIAGPSRDFTLEEREAVGAYLSKGGKIMAFIGPGESPFVNLGALLAEWGIVLMDGVIVEERAYAAGSPTNVIPRYAPHEINLYFAKNPYYVVMPVPRGIEVDGDKTGIYGTQALLSSTSDSFVAGIDGESKAGPFSLAALSERSVAGGARAGLFVAGSVEMYADNIMETPSYANNGFLARTLEYLMNLVNVADSNALTGAAAFSIPPKTIAPPVIAVPRSVLTATTTVFLFVLPLVALSGGALICATRRRR